MAAAITLATAMADKCSLDQLVALVGVWNHAACEPELEAAELQAVIDQATGRARPSGVPALVNAEAVPFKELWREPLDLWPVSSAPTDLPLDAVPEIVARFAHDRGLRLGVAPGAVAAALITSLGALVPAGNELQMRQRDPHWTVKPILWTAIIGEPGSNKSATLAAAVAPVKALEDQWRTHYAVETRRAEIEKRTGFANRSGRPDPTVESPLLTAPARPVYRQKIVNDATTEALAPLLAENPSGLLCYVDELAGLFGSMDAYRQKGGKDRPFWLQPRMGAPSRSTERQATASWLRTVRFPF
jgi:hypothetical protein